MASKSAPGLGARSRGSFLPTRFCARVGLRIGLAAGSQLLHSAAAFDRAWQHDTIVEPRRKQLAGGSPATHRGRAVLPLLNITPAKQIREAGHTPRCFRRLDRPCPRALRCPRRAQDDSISGSGDPLCSSCEDRSANPRERRTTSSVLDDLRCLQQTCKPSARVVRETLRSRSAVRTRTRSSRDRE